METSTWEGSQNETVEDDTHPFPCQPCFCCCPVLNESVLTEKELEEAVKELLKRLKIKLL